jgi:hypothetical protein
MVDRSTRRARMRASGGLATLALAAVLGGSACFPPPPLGTCPVAGSEPVTPIPDDLAALSDALEARFPSCFGGVVRTGPSSADLYVVGGHAPVLVLAQQLLGPTFDLTLRASDHALADVRALKHQIDADADELHGLGIPTSATGIRIVAAGPRVLVGLWPDSQAARTALEQRYGADWLVIEAYGPVEPD